MDPNVWKQPNGAERLAWKEALKPSPCKVGEDEAAPEVPLETRPPAAEPKFDTKVPHAATAGGSKLGDI